MKLTPEQENRLELTVDFTGTFTIIWYDKNGMRETWKGKQLAWIEQCRFFKHARKTKEIEKLKLVIDLLEANDYHCKTVLKQIKERKIPLPSYYHCYECPQFSMYSKNAPKKQA